MRSAVLALCCLTAAGQDLPRDKEAALGQRMAEEIRRSTTPVASREVQDYVGRLGAKVGAAGFTFEVVSTAESAAFPEAVRLPGGYIFVSVSLMLAANDEAEFAGMLAQAVGRAGAAGHWGDSFSRQPLLPVAVLRQRRIDELQADRSAVLAMSRAGFDPAALLRYVERGQPDDVARLAALRAAVREISGGDWSAGAEFYRIQGLVRPAPPTPRVVPSLFSK